MAQYRVTLTRNLYQCAFVYVDADSRNDAEHQVEQMIEDDDVLDGIAWENEEITDTEVLTSCVVDTHEDA